MREERVGTLHSFSALMSDARPFPLTEVPQDTQDGGTFQESVREDSPVTEVLKTMSNRHHLFHREGMISASSSRPYPQPVGPNFDPMAHMEANNSQRGGTKGRFPSLIV